MHEGSYEVETDSDVRLRPDWDDIFEFCPYCGVALKGSS
jgi:hypothetical protein